nr:uncharacterized protein LOC117278174 [Nicotiana tomentosiformis]
MDASRAKAIELKRQLTTLKKTISMSIDQYLREEKNTIRWLVSPLTSLDMYHLKICALSSFCMNNGCNAFKNPIPSSLIMHLLPRMINQIFQICPAMQHLLQVIVDEEEPRLFEVEVVVEGVVVTLVEVPHNCLLPIILLAMVLLLSLRQDKVTGQPLLQASSKDDVYPLSSSSVTSPPQAFVALRQSGDIWHRRLGHSGSRVLSSLRNHNLTMLLNSFSNNCVSCKLGKSQRLSFNLVAYYSSFPLDIIHSDVWHRLCEYLIFVLFLYSMDEDMALFQLYGYA